MEWTGSVSRICLQLPQPYADLKELVPNTSGAKAQRVIIMSDFLTQQETLLSFHVCSLHGFHLLLPSCHFRLQIIACDDTSQSKMLITNGNMLNYPFQHHLYQYSLCPILPRLSNPEDGHVSQLCSIDNHLFRSTKTDDQKHTGFMIISSRKIIYSARFFASSVAQSSWFLGKQPRRICTVVSQPSVPYALVVTGVYWK